MQICLIAHADSIHVQRWLIYFAQRGYELHLIDMSSESKPVIPDVTYHSLPQPSRSRLLTYISWSYSVYRIVRAIRPDVLHAHYAYGPGTVAAFARYHPFMLTTWGSDLLINVDHSWERRLAIRHVLRSADYVTCMTESMVKVAQMLGADMSRIEVAPWGIDADIFYPALPDSSGNGTFKRRTGRRPSVVSLRALKAIYNPLDIARSIPLVWRRTPHVEFIIRTYGCDRELLDAFQAIVSESGVADSVEYIGELSDDHAIANLYRNADVAVSVPSSDAMPVSVLEAMGCGVVPVLGDLPSLRELFTHEREVLFVPVGDVTTLAEAILRLLTDNELRARLRMNGLDLVRDKANQSAFMRRYEEIFEMLAS